MYVQGKNTRKIGCRNKNVMSTYLFLFLWFWVLLYHDLWVKHKVCDKPKNPMVDNNVGNIKSSVKILMPSQSKHLKNVLKMSCIVNYENTMIYFLIAFKIFL